MKTATAILSGITTSTSSASGLGLAVADLTALSVNDATIQVKVVTGATVPGVNKTLNIWVAFGDADYSGNADGINILKPSAVLTKVAVPNLASKTRVITTDKITLKSRYAHAWYDSDGLDAAVTLTVSIVS